MLIKLWRNLRLQNQLLIIQTLIVAIIFVILISLCLYLVQLFSNFIKQELLQQLILRSVVSTQQTAIIRVDAIGMTVYNLYQGERQYIQNLYEFQVKNNINVNSKVDDCLKSPHSQQFYSYQFCYGLYGPDQSSLDFNSIHNYTALQNQLIPFFQRKIIASHYNIQFGKTIYFSQYKGQFIKHIDKQILDAVQEMEESQSSDYFQQKLNYIGQIFLSINSLNNSIYIGLMLNQSENPYYKLTQQEQYFNQRILIVLESGFILSDTKGLIKDMQFQNTSATGFNDEQFEKVKNFANKNGSLINECDFQFNIQILCLNNIYMKQQLVFSKYLEKSGYYIIVLVDTILLNRIDNDFNQQLEQLIDNMFQNLGIQYMTAFIICILLQIAFIRKLNRPLKDLQKAAKSHINNYQQTFERIASVHQTKNQTQKLSEAFFNLITLNKNNKNKQQQYAQNSIDSKGSEGIIQRRESQNIILQMRWNIQKKHGYQTFEIE